MIAALSDIHGNLPALEAVLADMPSVREVWLLGDLIGELPFPCEVMDRLLALADRVPVYAVPGNREISLLEARAGEHPDWWQGTQMRAQAWTADQLTPRHWDFLAGLTYPLPRLDGQALLMHGTPRMVRGLVHNATQAQAAMDGLPYRLFCGGHVHRAQRYVLPGGIWIDAGAVGISLEGIAGIAAYALIDETREDYPTTFRHVPYPAGDMIRALKASPLWALAPGISHAVALELQTGEHHIQSLLAFARAYAERHTGGSPGDIPPALWAQAEAAWIRSIDGHPIT